MNPARSQLTVFSAAVIAAVAVLAVLLPAGAASAASSTAAGTRVGASHPQMILAVGVSRPVLPGEGLCEEAPQAQFVSGACVAAQDASDLADAAATCGGESFSAGTKVLLASGVAVPIASLRPGDKVLATSTTTGKTQAEPVVAVLVHHDTNRYDLTVKTAHGPAVIDTTSSHLFWDPSLNQWISADHLRPGEKLKTPDGQAAVVVGDSVPADHDGWMWDLTVQDDHDFYIDVAIAAVLVHNVSPAKSAAIQGTALIKP